MSRGPLAPLAALYGAGLAAKNLAYGRRWLTARQLRWPVVSIGNLSVGGSGKTPLTIRLIELLAAEGVSVDVLSRGYGRNSRGTKRVDPAGDARRFGDEPLLIARRSGAAVFVGASRYEAGLLAEAGGEDPDWPSNRLAANLAAVRPAASPAAVHLLDDGFQHRQLARNVDIVLLHRTDFSERLLPAGRLREPLSALNRADFVVLREEDADLEPELKRLGIGTPIWWVRRSLHIPEDLLPTDGSVVAFCGIARPKEFFSALVAQGIDLKVMATFADHHRYARQDVDRLVQAAKSAGASAFLTTEKDAVKLDAELLRRLEAVAPVRVARLEISLQDETAVIAGLAARLPSTFPGSG